MGLECILEQKRKETLDLLSPKRSLYKAISQPGLSVIAEIKKASPSCGTFLEEMDPVSFLQNYEQGQADAISIVTERHFFKGDPETLRMLRPRTQLPLLRKDFILDIVDVYESLFLGADAILLIMSTLNDGKLKELAALTQNLGMEVLLEVHNEEELLRALEMDIQILGFNNRDLKDFSVNLKTSERLMNLLKNREPRTKRRLIAESGIHTSSEAAYLRDLGFDGILVGEALIRSENPARQILTLKGGCA